MVIEDKEIPMSSRELLGSLSGEEPNSIRSCGEEEEEKKDDGENLMEDCPICCEPMSQADLDYPMHCEQVGCHFNYCTQCVWSLLVTSNQPYQEASDGSMQLKVPLQCPQCRSKYRSRQLVQDTILLRQAANLEPMMFGSTKKKTGDTFTASQLAAQHNFVQQITWEALFDAFLRVRKYQKDIYAKDSSRQLQEQLQPLTEQWKEVLSVESYDSNEDEAASRAEAVIPRNVILVDPTLCRGLHDYMTMAEQQFLTQLLTHNHVPSLMEAAQILHGTLGLLQARSDPKTLHRRPSGVVQMNVLTGSCAEQLLPHEETILYPEESTWLDLKKRFPVPTRFPQMAILPIFDPFEASTSRLFLRTTAPFTLGDDAEAPGPVILSVRGEAGRLGIRKGDYLTHLNDEPLEGWSVVQLHAFLRQLYQRNSNQMMTWLVNACPSVAQALHDRAQKMIPHLQEQYDKTHPHHHHHHSRAQESITSTQG